MHYNQEYYHSYDMYWFKSILYFSHAFAIVFNLSICLLLLHFYISSGMNSMSNTCNLNYFTIINLVCCSTASTSLFILFSYRYYLAVVLSTVNHSVILNIMLSCWVLYLLNSERPFNLILTFSVVKHAIRTALTCSIWFACILAFFIYDTTHYEYPWCVRYLKYPWLFMVYIFIISYLDCMA